MPKLSSQNIQQSTHNLTCPGIDFLQEKWPSPQSFRQEDSLTAGKFLDYNMARFSVSQRWTKVPQA